MDKVETVKVAGGADYAMVVNRVHKFKEMYEDGQILTEMVKCEDDTGEVVFKAMAVVGGVIRGTGHAMEVRGASNINKTSHIECAETSAIGRCLAFGIGLMPSGSIASYEEVENAKLQQENLKQKDRIFDICTDWVSVGFQTAIDEDDEEAILEVLADFKGNQDLKTAVWNTLNPEQAQYMQDRAVKLSEESKKKSEEKLASNKAYAKEFAEKQKAKAK